MTKINNKYTVYYKNQMTNYYKNEEKHLQKIIPKFIKPKEPDKIVKLLIYYKTRKIKNLLINKNLSHIDNKDHIVYEFTCPENSVMQFLIKLDIQLTP